MEKDYVIYSLKLANALAKQGFKIVGTGINMKNPKYTVFYFEDTEELRETISLLKSKV